MVCMQLQCGLGPPDGNPDKRQRLTCEHCSGWTTCAPASRYDCNLNWYMQRGHGVLGDLIGCQVTKRDSWSPRLSSILTDRQRLSAAPATVEHQWNINISFLLVSSSLVLFPSLCDPAFRPVQSPIHSIPNTYAGDTSSCVLISTLLYADHSLRSTSLPWQHSTLPFFFINKQNYLSLSIIFTTPPAFVLPLNPRIQPSQPQRNHCKAH